MHPDYWAKINPKYPKMTEKQQHKYREKMWKRQWQGGYWDCQEIKEWAVCIMYVLCFIFLIVGMSLPFMRFDGPVDHEQREKNYEKYKQKKIIEYRKKGFDCSYATGELYCRKIKP